MNEWKFKIGDVLRHKVSDEKIVIIERINIDDIPTYSYSCGEAHIKKGWGKSYIEAMYNLLTKKTEETKAFKDGMSKFKKEIDDLLFYTDDPKTYLVSDIEELYNNLKE